MPIFAYRCDKCEKTLFRLFKKRELFIECECGEQAAIQLPKNIDTMSMEIKDKNRNVVVQKDLDKKLKERMNNHHDESDEILEKIDKYGLDDAEKHGWTKKIKNKI